MNGWNLIQAAFLGALVSLGCGAKNGSDSRPVLGGAAGASDVRAGTSGLPSEGGSPSTGGVPSTEGAVNPEGGNTADDSSLEFGRTEYGNDNATRADAPAGGTLFSVWTRIPDPGSSYPWSRGNMDVYVLYGDNWSLRCLVGNSGANSPADARYNANSMLFVEPGYVWIADYSYYDGGFGHPEAPYRDWVWVAWHVVVQQSSIAIRQWLKLGVDGEVFAAGESAPTFDEIRGVLVDTWGWTQAEATAWTPSDAERFQVGSYSGYLTHARMMARKSVPSLSELDAIARRDEADSSAWADYRLNWVDGKPNLQDRSGNGRHLTLGPGGTLYEGPPGPEF